MIVFVINVKCFTEESNRRSWPISTYMMLDVDEPATLETPHIGDDLQLARNGWPRR